MEIKVRIPENVNDITLGQYQRFTEVIKKDYNDYDMLIRKIAIFTGLTLEQCKELTQKDLEGINEDINKALQEEPKFLNRFFIGDVEFGFIPNFDKIKGKEYFDLSEYANKEEYLHNLMSILFRPIINKGVKKIKWYQFLKRADNSVNKDTYNIMEYEGTEKYANIMKLMPLGAVNGSLAFFLTLQNELREHIQKYMAVEQVKER